MKKSEHFSVQAFIDGSWQCPGGQDEWSGGTIDEARGLRAHAVALEYEPVRLRIVRADGAVVEGDPSDNNRRADDDLDTESEHCEREPGCWPDSCVAQFREFPPDQFGLYDVRWRAETRPDGVQRTMHPLWVPEGAELVLTSTGDPSRSEAAGYVLRGVEGADVRRLWVPEGAELVLTSTGDPSLLESIGSVLQVAVSENAAGADDPGACTCEPGRQCCCGYLGDDARIARFREPPPDLRATYWVSWRGTRWATISGAAVNQIWVPVGARLILASSGHPSLIWQLGQTFQTAVVEIES